MGHAESANATSRDVITRVTDSRASVVLLAAAIAIVATLTMIAPRVAHTFPSMVDDWAAIETSLDQLPEALTGRNPEELRYRPGWVVWNAVQWHTLGAPTQRWGPQVWGMLRLAVLALGLAALAATIVRWPRGRRGRLTVVAMVVGVPLVVMTIPAFAIDLARWGPQEPLLVGAMSLGAALIAWSLRAAARSRGPTPIVSLAVGVALWWIGALQKETSLAVLALVPFLWPYVRRNRLELRDVIRERPMLVTATAVGVVAPLLLMAWYTIALATADTRVYGAQASPDGMLGRLTAQLNDIDGTLGTPFAWLVLAAFFLSLFWAVGRDVDWLALGLLTCALAFTLWASQTGVVQSRYYLPGTALVVLALVRTASTGPRRVLVPAVVATLLADRLNGGHEGAADWLIREAHDPTKRVAIAALACLALGIAVVAKVDRRAVLAVAAAALLLAVVAETTNEVVSRFYPAAALVALLGLTLRPPQRSFSAPLVASVLIAVSLVNVPRGRDAVDVWLARERAQETLVREVAAREAGGCTVTAVGVEAEFVDALPVLRRFVDEPASGCTHGERFVAVVDGDRSSVRTPPTDPVVAACAPSEVVWRSRLARILRCGITA